MAIIRFIIRFLLSVAISVPLSFMLTRKLIYWTVKALVRGLDPAILAYYLCVYYLLGSPGDHLDAPEESGPDLGSETSQDSDSEISDQQPDTADLTPADSTGPAIQLCNCYFCEESGLNLHQPWSDSSSVLTPSSSSEEEGGFVTAPRSPPAPPHSPPLSGSEGHDIRPEEAALPKAMAGKGAVSYVEKKLVHHQNSIKDGSQIFGKKQDWDAKMIQRRNVKMREEGVRVNVKYSQLAIPTRPLPALTVTTAVAPTAATSSSSSTGVTRTPSTVSSGSLSPFNSGLESPAPTPCAGINSATIPTRHGQPEVLPTSGNAAGEVLYRIDEKLLALPADATSRRLLRDGRALLHRKKRAPRSSAPSPSAYGGESGYSAASEASSLRSADKSSSSGYASELIE